MIKIGEVVIDLRKQKGWKQKELAEMLGISATYLSLIENNEQKPSIELISKIANHFGLPTSAILFKAMNIDGLENKDQKKYFKAAEPIVNSLIDYLLSGDSTKEGDDNLIDKIKPKLTKRKSA